MERIWYLDWIPHFSTARLIDPPPQKYQIINYIHCPETVIHLGYLKCMTRQKEQNLLHAPFEVKVTHSAGAVWVDATAGVHTKH